MPAYFTWFILLGKDLSQQFKFSNELLNNFEIFEILQYDIYTLKEAQISPVTFIFFI